jgi:hypothetical protein
MPEYDSVRQSSSAEVDRLASPGRVVIMLRALYPQCLVGWCRFRQDRVSPVLPRLLLKKSSYAPRIALARASASSAV